MVVRERRFVDICVIMQESLTSRFYALRYSIVLDKFCRKTEQKTCRHLFVVCYMYMPHGCICQTDRQCNNWYATHV